jgi:hypothetical protein
LKSKGGVFIKGGGGTGSENVDNGLKLLSKFVSECSGTITQWIKGFKVMFGVLPDGSKTCQ